MKAALVLFFITFLVFGHTTQFDFVYDDIPHIVLNPQVVDVNNWTKIFVSPTFPGDLYRPLTTLSYAATAALTGMAPLPFHLINILLHSLVGLFAFLLFQAFGIRKAPSFVAALIFLCHPLTAEPVSNVVGRAELLASLFGLSALLAALAGRSSVLIGTFLFFATLSKESAFSFLFLVLMATWWKHPTHIRGAFAATLLVVVASLGLRYLALGSIIGLSSDGVTTYSENPIFHLSLSDRIIPTLAVLGRYLQSAVLPLNLSADYSMMPHSFQEWIRSPGGIAATGLPLLFSLGLLFKHPTARFFVAWFFVSFIPTCNLLIPIGTIQADRLMYTPLIGLTGLLAVAIQCARTQRATIALSLIAALTLAAAAHQRAYIWKNKTSLFSQTSLDAPLSPKAQYHYGLVLYVDQKRPDLAAPLFERAVELDPSHIRAMKCLADIALLQGNRERLEYWYHRILKVDPNDDRIHHYLNVLNDLKRATD